MRMTYRQWVEAGARGFFMTGGLVTEGVVIVATELAFPESLLATQLQGYFVHRQSYDPASDGAQRGSALREEWLADPKEAVTFGWVSWETDGEVVDGMNRSNRVKRDTHESLE